MGRDEAITLAVSGAVLMALAFAVSLASAGGRHDGGWGSSRTSPAVPCGTVSPSRSCGGVALWLALVAVFAAAALACAVGGPALPGVIARYVDGLWSQAGEMGVILGLATAMMLAGLATDAFEPGGRPASGSRSRPRRPWRRSGRGSPCSGRSPTRSSAAW